MQGEVLEKSTKKNGINDTIPTASYRKLLKFRSTLTTISPFPPQSVDYYFIASPRRKKYKQNGLVHVHLLLPTCLFFQSLI